MYYILSSVFCKLLMLAPQDKMYHTDHVYPFLLIVVQVRSSAVY